MSMSMIKSKTMNISGTVSEAVKLVVLVSEAEVTIMTVVVVVIVAIVVGNVDKREVATVTGIELTGNMNTFAAMVTETETESAKVEARAIGWMTEVKGEVE